MLIPGEENIATLNHSFDLRVVRPRSRERTTLPQTFSPVAYEKTLPVRDILRQVGDRIRHRKYSKLSNKEIQDVLTIGLR